MSRRALRGAFIVGLLTLMSTFARSALASETQRWAPYCDDRGATAVAPPPALEAPDEAIRRARASTCASDELTLHAVATQGHRSGHSFSSDAPQALATETTTLVSPPGETMDAAPVTARAAQGARERLDRPPRG